jgi:alpha-tubulin suppressor-like RCC1 family protein
VPGISAGYNHTCAIRTDGTLSCWGANGQGQVGTTTNLVTRFLVPSPVMNLTNVSAVAAGGFHTCALSGGLVFCWGSSSYGQVGVGGAIPGSPVRTPTQVAGLSNVVSIAAGQFHTCAVRANGTMACWGDGFDGQLGTGIAGGSYATSVPVNVPGVNNAVEVTAGFGHTCIRRSNNTASCWGANNNGQLGDGTSSQDPVPSPVNVQLSNVTSIRAGFGFTCAIAGGQPSCWGENTNGNLGGSTLANESVDPLTIPLTALGGDVLDATVVSGGGDHACARRAAGTVRCWGLNGRGQHGTGNTLSSLIRNSDGQPVGYRQPIDIPDLTNVSALVTGEDHACVRRTNGSIACWGWNDSGQIGNNTRTTQLSPVNIAGF